MNQRSRRLTTGLATVLLAILVALQLVPVERENPPVESLVQAPAEVEAILRRACFDCHSHETIWPWYSRVAPISWWIAEHVREGRADLNFSRWPTFDFAAQDHIYLEIAKQLRADAMPLPSYRRGHPEARLDEEDRQLLLDWARVEEPEWQ